MKTTGRSFTLDDVDAVDEDLSADIDNFATSKPSDETDKKDEE